MTNVFYTRQFYQKPQFLVFLNKPLLQQTLSPVKQQLIYIETLKVVQKLSKSNNLFYGFWKYGHASLWEIERFCSALFNSKIWINFAPYADNLFSIVDWSWIYFFAARFQKFEYLLGKRMGNLQLAKAFYFGIGLKDLKPLIRIFRFSLNRINFWKHRLIIHLIKYVFLLLTATFTTRLSFVGLKFRLKGKISVGGNSRKRTHAFQSGKVSFATKKHRVLSASSTLSTFTGVLSFRFWVFY